VTYILEGAIRHGDSRGNKGVYGVGDVQWLTAGSGVLHSEMFITDEKEPTKFTGFQLWLNLSAKQKMCDPAYQMSWSKDIPQLDLTDINSNGKINVKVIAGAQSNIKKEIPLSYLHVKMEQKTKWTFPIPSDHNAFIYILNGVGLIGTKKNRKTTIRYIRP